MKNEPHPIDNLFRKGLEGLEASPAPERRELFLKEAAAPARRTNNRNYILLLGALLVLLSGIAFISYLTLFENEESLSSNSSSTESALPTPVQPYTNNSKTHTSTYINTSEHKDLAGNKMTVPAQPGPEASPDTMAVTSERPVITGAVIQESSQGIDQVVSIDTTRAADPDVPTDTTVTTDPDVDMMPHSDSTDTKPAREQKERDWSISAGISYTPEWMFNTIDDVKFVNNFGIEGTFTFGLYSVRTGIGLSIAKGITEVGIGYNDYLGSYMQLDSISFAWDDQHYRLLPTYYMTDADVWDSLMKLDYPKIEKRYIYLQVPLILGYDFIKKNRFSFGARVGPILSILLSSNELTPDYDPGMNRIIQINQITPDRIQTNWQVMGGISAGYLLSKRIKIELEPEGRYYFNSVYEKGGLTQKPWSVGVRTAIIFTF